MERSLGADWERLLRSAPYSLRFDLGGEHSNIEAPVRRFLQAFDRARAVADAIFAQTEVLSAVIASSPETDVWAELHAMGFLPPAAWRVWHAPYAPDDGEEANLNLEWRAIDVDDRPSRDILLWAAITWEMPIEPSAGVTVFLADFSRDLLLHPYDDRGMDVDGLDRALIEPIYRQFDAWLLDYDRPRMTAAMGF